MQLTIVNTMHYSWRWTIAFLEYIYHHIYSYIPIIELLIDWVTSNSFTFLRHVAIQPLGEMFLTIMVR